MICCVKLCALHLPCKGWCCCCCCRCCYRTFCSFFYSKRKSLPHCVESFNYSCITNCHKVNLLDHFVSFGFLLLFVGFVEFSQCKPVSKSSRIFCFLEFFFSCVCIIYNCFRSSWFSFLPFVVRNTIFRFQFLCNKSNTNFMLLIHKICLVFGSEYGCLYAFGITVSSTNANDWNCCCCCCLLYNDWWNGMRLECVFLYQHAPHAYYD